MLAGFDIASEHAEVYAEGLKRGCVMVLVNTPEERSQDARTILDQANAANVTDLEHEFRSDGWSRTTDPAGSASGSVRVYTRPQDDNR